MCLPELSAKPQSSRLLAYYNRNLEHEEKLAKLVDKQEVPP